MHESVPVTFTVPPDVYAGRKIRSYESNESTLCWIFGFTADGLCKTTGNLKVTRKYKS